MHKIATLVYFFHGVDLAYSLVVIVVKFEMFIPLMRNLFGKTRVGEFKLFSPPFSLPLAVVEKLRSKGAQALIVALEWAHSPGAFAKWRQRMLAFR